MAFIIPPDEEDLEALIVIARNLKEMDFEFHSWRIQEHFNEYHIVIERTEVLDHMTKGKARKFFNQEYN